MSVCYTVKFGLFSEVNLEKLMDTYQHQKRNVFYKYTDKKGACLLFAEGSIRPRSLLSIIRIGRMRRSFLRGSIFLITHI